MATPTRTTISFRAYSELLMQKSPAAFVRKMVINMGCLVKDQRISIGDLMGTDLADNISYLHLQLRRYARRLYWCMQYMRDIALAVSSKSVCVPDINTMTHLVEVADYAEKVFSAFDDREKLWYNAETGHIDTKIHDECRLAAGMVLKNGIKLCCQLEPTQNLAFHCQDILLCIGRCLFKCNRYYTPPPPPPLLDSDSNKKKVGSPWKDLLDEMNIVPPEDQQEEEEDENDDE